MASEDSGQHPAHLARRASQRAWRATIGWFDRQPRNRKRTLVVASAVTVLLLTGGIAALASGGDDGASAMALALSKSAAPVTGAFFGVTPTRGIHCSDSGSRGGTAVYECTWSIEGKPESADFEMFDGSPARISEGGEGTRPPSDNAAASALASTVAREGGSYKCERALEEENPIIHEKTTLPPNTYMCTAEGPGDEPTEVEHLIRRFATKWRWNRDGSVAEESLTESSILSNYKLESEPTSPASTPTETTPNTSSESTTTTPPASTPEQSTATSCGTADYGEIDAITASGVSCEVARAVVTAAGERQRQADGMTFECTSEERYYEFSWSCVAGAARVVYHGYTQR